MGKVFYNQQINKGTSHFTILRRAQKQIPMHSNSIGYPKILPPVCFSFVLVILSDMHLEPESEKRAKNIDFHTAKSVQIRATLVRYFKTNSYSMTSDLFTVV